MAAEQQPDVAGGDERSELLRKFRERKERHQQRGLPARAAVVVAGVLLVLVGIVLSGPGIPGPGFLVILLGISFVALEFAWAEALLEKAIVWSERAKERAARTTPRQKALAGAAALVAVAAFVWAALRWDIPLLPL